PQRITVSLIDRCGRKANASVQVVNLPSAIRNAHAGLGGAPVSGALEWATERYGCKLVLYQNLAIANSDGTVCTILSPIFPKWKDWVSKRYHAMSFNPCPTSDRRTVEGGSIAQDFGS